MHKDAGPDPYLDLLRTQVKHNNLRLIYYYNC